MSTLGLDATEPLRSDAFDAPVITEHEGWLVVREDMRPGGTKGRFMRSLIHQDTTHVVYGGPAWGGAAAALAMTARELAIDCTLFYAQRGLLTTRQLYALSVGAELIGVQPGYLAVVQARAREYVASRPGRQLLHWGAPELEDNIKRLAWLYALHLDFTEAWVAVGSGVTLRALAAAFWPRPVFGVSVGRTLPREAWGRAAGVIRHPSGFDVATRTRAPFPTCPHYDGKAWELARSRHLSERPLFWNVMGPEI